MLWSGWPRIFWFLIIIIIIGISSNSSSSRSDDDDDDDDDDHHQHPFHHVAKRQPSLFRDHFVYIFLTVREHNYFVKYGYFLSHQKAMVTEPYHLIGS